MIPLHPGLTYEISRCHLHDTSQEKRNPHRAGWEGGENLISLPEGREKLPLGRPEKIYLRTSNRQVRRKSQTPGKGKKRILLEPSAEIANMADTIFEV